MKVALYARVSKQICNICGKGAKSHQDGGAGHDFKPQDPEVQLQPLRQMCHSRGWTITHEYIDRAFSGRKASRPALDQLMADAKQGLRDIEAIACWKFDRFARSTIHLLRALETFQSLQIAFISLTEAVDTSTPYGKLVFTILAAVAELEISLMTERIRAGMSKDGAKKPGPKVGIQGPSRTTRWRMNRAKSG